MATEETICFKCQNNLTTPGFNWCKECWLASNNNGTNDIIKCTTCDSRAKVGSNLCEICFQIELDNSKAYAKCIMCDKSLKYLNYDLCKSCLKGTYNEYQKVEHIKKCVKCNTLPANTGYDLCEKCHKENQTKLYENPCLNCRDSNPNFNTGLCDKCELQLSINQRLVSKVCQSCNNLPANYGYDLCQSCFIKSQSNVGTLNISIKMCTNCGERSTNRGYPLCQQCYKNGQNAMRNHIQCIICNTRPPNKGFELCQTCYQFHISFNSILSNSPHVLNTFEFSNNSTNSGMTNLKHFSFKNDKPKSILEMSSTQITPKKKASEHAAKPEIVSSIQCLCSQCSYEDDKKDSLDYYYCNRCFEFVTRGRAEVCYRCQQTMQCY